MSCFLQKCCARYVNSYTLPGMAFLAWFTLLPAWDLYQLVSAVINPPHQPRIFTLTTHIVGSVWIFGCFTFMGSLVATSVWHSFKGDWGRWAIHSFFFALGIALSILCIILDFYVLGFCRISGN